MDATPRKDLRVDGFGERALLVRAADQGRIQALTAGLLGALAAGRLADVVPGDRTLLVTFDGTADGEAAARVAISAAAAHAPAPAAPRRHVIPVRYGGTDGPDLDDVARLAGRTPDDVVALHTGRDHPVLFIGFAPGFPYIGGLAPELVLPRLATPRTSTPPGSVAIAEAYTGIYPVALPGGWRVIGRTATSMFDPRADPPTTLLPGDLVRFEAIR
jgi:KipI family sensor histidine kinase inhibitor